MANQVSIPRLYLNFRDHLRQRLLANVTRIVDYVKSLYCLHPTIPRGRNEYATIYILALMTSKCTDHLGSRDDFDRRRVYPPLPDLRPADSFHRIRYFGFLCDRGTPIPICRPALPRGTDGTARAPLTHTGSTLPAATISPLA
jgi:hypothetical protein